VPGSGICDALENAIRQLWDRHDLASKNRCQELRANFDPKSSIVYHPVSEAFAVRDIGRESGFLDG
jgi:hypothetical protein